MTMTEKSIAAIFDVDGTLLPGTSMEWQLGRYLWKHAGGKGRMLRHWVGGAVEDLLAGRPMLQSNKGYFRGMDVVRLSQLAQGCFAGEIWPRLSPDGLARLRWHQQAGHFVILLSGAPDLLLELLAEHLGVHARIGTMLEVEGRRLTGRICGPHPIGPAKIELARQMSRLGVLSLKRSFAYADRYSDRFLLDAVGYPIAVNPDAPLRRLAMAKGWMIEEFTHGKPLDGTDRTAVAEPSQRRGSADPALPALLDGLAAGLPGKYSPLERPLADSSGIDGDDCRTGLCA